MLGISSELQYVCNKCLRELYISRSSYLNNIEIKCSCGGIYVNKYIQKELDNDKNKDKEIEK